MCLPQFAKRGPLQQHGFARNVSWELAAGSGSDGVELHLDVTDAQASEYDFDGRLSAVVHVRTETMYLCVEILMLTCTGVVD